MYHNNPLLSYCYDELQIWRKHYVKEKRAGKDTSNALYFIEYWKDVLSFNQRTLL